MKTCIAQSDVHNDKIHMYTVTEQVEFGAFQKLGDKSTKKQGAV